MLARWSVTAACLAACVLVASSRLALAQPADTPASGAPRPIAQKVVSTLPHGPLYWTVQSFDSLAQAKDAAGDYGLVAQADGKAWLFTLGAQQSGGSPSGADAPVQAGPITPPQATRFLLRINEGLTPPGRATPVHSHPGSEAFYVLAGAVQYKTAQGTFTVAAGQTAAGPPPNTTMQATSVGAVAAHNFIMFVLDADKPAQASAAF
ncbi:MAG: hypothetical protein NVS2B4_19870 [Ramlibacter sp.]